VSRTVNHETGLLLEVPDLVEYPSVVAGTFALEFLELPEEVLTTTADSSSALLPGRRRGRQAEERVFFAVINTRAGQTRRTIARNAERRGHRPGCANARFFWEADRKIPLASADRSARHAAVPQEARELQGEGPSGSGALAEWIAGEGARRRCRGRPKLAGTAAAAREKPTSPPTWCASSRSCKGAMGGIYAKAEGPARGSVEGDSTTTTCRSASRPTRRRRARATRESRGHVGRGSRSRDKLGHESSDSSPPAKKPTGFARSLRTCGRAAQGGDQDPGRRASDSGIWLNLVEAGVLRGMRPALSSKTRIWREAVVRLHGGSGRSIFARAARVSKYDEVPRP